MNPFPIAEESSFCVRATVTISAVCKHHQGVLRRSWRVKIGCAWLSLEKGPMNRCRTSGPGPSIRISIWIAETDGNVSFGQSH